MYHKFGRIIVVILVSCIVPVLAQAATLQITAGQLMGAKGVSVNGARYDVEFVDTTCVALYSGCNSADDFTFKDISAATAASQALLDQVLIGDFDIIVNLLNGIEMVEQAVIFTPYALWSFNPTRFQSSFAINGPGYGDKVNRLDGITFNDSRSDLSDQTGIVYARWTQRAQVPAPASALLMIPGVIGFICTRRKRALSFSYRGSGRANQL